MITSIRRPCKYPTATHPCERSHRIACSLPYAFPFPARSKAVVLGAVIGNPASWHSGLTLHPPIKIERIFSRLLGTSCFWHRYSKLRPSVYLSFQLSAYLMRTRAISKHTRYLEIFDHGRYDTSAVATSLRWNSLQN